MKAELPHAFRRFWAGGTVSNFGSWITLLTRQAIVVDYLHAGPIRLQRLRSHSRLSRRQGR